MADLLVPFPGIISSKTGINNKFNGANRNGCSCKDTWSQDLRGKLSSKLVDYPGLKTSADTYMNAYCCACDMKKKNSLNKGDAPCYFFYYWMGYQFFMDPCNTDLGDFMGKIQETLQGVSSEYKCNVKFKDVDSKTFNRRKDVYYFLYYYEEIKEQLGTCGSTREQKYSNYLKKITTTYNAVEADCNDSSDDDYCTKFWDQHRDEIKNKLSELECKQAAAEEKSATCSCEDKESLTSHLPHNNHLSTTTTAISSILGTLAVTAAPLLLYKNNLIPPWFRNHFGGRKRAGQSRRKRRSTERNFDTLTEDTSTTVDFTGSSETGSTIDDSTVRSTAYGRPSATGRTRTGAGTNANNNNTPGHHQRNNIGYGSM